MRTGGWRFWGLIAGAGVLSILTGCASVIHGTSQTVKIQTLTAEGKVVDGAKCLLTNDRNDLVMRSGESVTVRRAGAALNIECTQPDHAPASGQAISRVNAGMVGNILLGGAIGAVVDSSTGAGFNYPSWMQLVFGEVRNYDRSAQTGDLALAGVRIGEAKLASAAPGKTAPAVVAAAVPAPAPAPAAVPVPAPVAEAPPAPVATVAVNTPAVPPPVAAPAAPIAAAAPAMPLQPAAPAPRATEGRVSMDDLGALLPGRQ